jgi:hypothetical protein
MTVASPPGLIRMILVDGTLLPGRVDELPLDGHTVLLAQNGSGKTSLIQLIPFFYGEKMSSLVHSGQRDSFIDFYLPRSSSYIAFEYVNAHGDVRSVAMHADPSRERIQYRFIRGGLSADMFTVRGEDGEMSFVPTNGFDRRLRDLGVGFENLVTSTRGYRGVIQGHVDASVENRAFHAQLMADYGVGTRKAPLTGIEKLLTQMLRNNVSIRSMLGVVARQALEDGGDVCKLLGDSRAEHIAVWPGHYAAYRKIMEGEDQARQMAARKLEVDGLRAEIVRRFDALAAWQEDLEAEKIDLAKDLADLDQIQATAERRHKEALRTCEDEIQKLDSLVERLARDISHLDRSDAELRSQGADRAAGVVAAIPDLRNGLEAARARHEALTARDAEIGRRFSAARRDAEARAQADRDRRRAAAEAELEAIDGEVEAVRSAGDALARTTRDEGAARIDAIDREVLDLRSQRDLLLRQAADIVADPGISGALDGSRAALLVAERDLSDLKAADRDAEIALKDATSALQLGEKTLEAAQRALEDAQSFQERLRLEQAPKSGTLLADLRSSRPDWGATIGKVIRPELLQMTGLSPSFSPDGDGEGIYGLRLDLDRIPTPDHADESLLETRLMAAAAAVDAAAARLASERRTHEERGRRRREADDRRQTTEAKIRVARPKAIAARETAEIARERLDLHLKEKRSGLDKAAATVGERIEENLQRRAAADAALRDRLAQISRDTEQSRSASFAKKAHIKARRDAEIAAISEDLDRALRDLEDAQAASLSEAGIDAVLIRAVEAEIAANETSLREALSLRPLADAWDAHLRAMAGRADLEARLKTAEFDRLAARDALAAARQARTIEIEALELRRRSATARQREVEVSLHAISARFSEKPDFATSVPRREEAHAEGLEANLRAVATLAASLRDASTQALNLVRRLSALFRNSRHPGISGYLETLEGDISLSWADPILAWYRGEHLRFRDTLLDAMTAVIQPILAAHHQLKDADGAIRRINHSLGDAIRSNAGFPHVSDVKISIRFDLSRQAFWPDLDALEQAYRQWRNAQDAAPSEALVKALEAFLAHWDGKAEPVVHIEQLLYIDGEMTERGRERKFNRETDLSNLSSNGNIIVLRLILFTALLTIMRRRQPVRLVWAVDEIGALDVENARSLLSMLEANGIALLTAAPNLERRVKHLFPRQMRIQDGQLYRLGVERGGIREWTDAGELAWPGGASEDAADETVEMEGEAA